MEETGGGGDSEGWFEEGGRPKSSEMARWCESDCHRSEVNPATPVFGDKPGLKLEEEEEEEEYTLQTSLLHFLCYQV